MDVFETEAVCYCGAERAVVDPQHDGHVTVAEDVLQDDAGLDVDDVVLGQHRDSAGFVDPCGLECLPRAGAPAPLARFHWAQMPLEPHGAAGAEPPARRERTRASPPQCSLRRRTAATASAERSMRSWETGSAICPMGSQAAQQVPPAIPGPPAERAHPLTDGRPRPMTSSCHGATCAMFGVGRVSCVSA